MGDDLPDYELGINVLKQTLANLTATVEQLTTVEVDVVAQSLSDLSAVVSATALDIRALASQDKAHITLPYDLSYGFLQVTNLADGAAGADNNAFVGDAYILPTFVELMSATEMNQKYFQGLWYRISTDGQNFLEESITAQDQRQFYYATGTSWRLKRMFPSATMFVVDDDEALYGTFYNESGVTLTIASIYYLYYIP